MKTIGLYLNSPLQSWAGPAVVKTRVDTQNQPSERAIKGLLEAAFGVPRNQTNPIIEKSNIDISVLHPGHIVKDFQIISNRLDEEEFLVRIGRVLNLSIKPAQRLVSDNSKGNSIVRRTYLADSKFLILVNGSTDEDTEIIYNKLLQPVWTPYLGKRAFPPTFPFILGIFDSDNPKESAINRILEIEGKEK